MELDKLLSICSDSEAVLEKVGDEESVLSAVYEFSIAPKLISIVGVTGTALIRSVMG